MSTTVRCPHTDKVIYDSQAAANRAVHQIEDHVSAGQEPLHAYPCPKAPHWHVGHRTKPKTRPTPSRRVKARRDGNRRRDAPQGDAELWRELNDALLRRSNGRCERCGRDLLAGGVPVSRHHRQRRRDGGDRLSNLLLLCGTGTTMCHGWITEHPEEAREHGWIVDANGGADPALVPVRLANGYLYRLRDDGGTVPLP